MHNLQFTSGAKEAMKNIIKHKHDETDTKGIKIYFQCKAPCKNQGSNRTLKTG